jgi:phosphonate transport system substrate-binding protein
MRVKSFLFLFLSISLFACSPKTATPVAVSTESPIEENPIVFGDISDDPTEVINGAQPIVDYLASQLADHGITGGEVRVASSTEEMIELLKNGEVDLYFDSTYPATLISDASGAQIILRRWRFGVETYHGVIFATKDSGITDIEGLKGKMVAMDAPYSTSGFLLPAVHLTEHGLMLVGKKGNQDPVASEEVGFAFAYDDENILQWVLSGLTPAGVTDDYHFDVAFPPEVKENLVELARTESTPRQVAVARPGLDPDLLQAIEQILTSMHETTEGAAVLENFQTEKFDEFPEGLEEATTRMREMMELVKDIPLP